MSASPHASPQPRFSGSHHGRISAPRNLSSPAWHGETIPLDLTSTSTPPKHSSISNGVVVAVSGGGGVPPVSNGAPPPPPPPQRSEIDFVVGSMLRSGEWCMVVDSVTNRPYYYSTVDGCTTWDLAAIVRSVMRMESIAAASSGNSPSHNQSGGGGGAPSPQPTSSTFPPPPPSEETEVLSDPRLRAQTAPNRSTTSGGPSSPSGKSLRKTKQAPRVPSPVAALQTPPRNGASTSPGSTQRRSSPGLAKPQSATFSGGVGDSTQQTGGPSPVSTATTRRNPFAPPLTHQEAIAALQSNPSGIDTSVAPPHTASTRRRSPAAAQSMAELEKKFENVNEVMKEYDSCHSHTGGEPLMGRSGRSPARRNSLPRDALHQRQPSTSPEPTPFSHDTSLEVLSTTEGGSAQSTPPDMSIAEVTTTTDDDERHIEGQQQQQLQRHPAPLPSAAMRIEPHDTTRVRASTPPKDTAVSASDAPTAATASTTSQCFSTPPSSERPLSEGGNTGRDSAVQRLDLSSSQPVVNSPVLHPRPAATQQHQLQARPYAGNRRLPVNNTSTTAIAAPAKRPTSPAKLRTSSPPKPVRHSIYSDYRSSSGASSGSTAAVDAGSSTCNPRARTPKTSSATHHSKGGGISTVADGLDDAKRWRIGGGGGGGVGHVVDSITTSRSHQQPSTMRHGNAPNGDLTSSRSGTPQADRSPHQRSWHEELQRREADLAKKREQLKAEREARSNRRNSIGSPMRRLNTSSAAAVSSGSPHSTSSTVVRSNTSTTGGYRGLHGGSQRSSSANALTEQERASL